MATPRNGLPALVDEQPRGGGGTGRGAPADPEKRAARRQKVLLIGSIVAIIAAAVMLLTSLRGEMSPGEAARLRVVIDSETGEVIEDFRVSDGSAYPLRNPRTGTETLYPAEACYWNADGTAKLTPTYVFVKSYAGASGDTKCPDCGRRVVTHNPMPPDELMLAAAERMGSTGGAGGK